MSFRLVLRTTLAVAVAGALGGTLVGPAAAAPTDPDGVAVAASTSGYQSVFVPTVPNPTTATASELVDAAKKAGSRSLTAPTLNQRTASAVTRSDVISRAMSWVNAGVPYSMYAYRTDANGRYRTDCSGFVSMAWNLASSSANNWGETTGSLPDFSTAINKEDLKPGDILLNTASGASGHVVIFNGWTNSAHTEYDGLEEAGSVGAVRRHIPYPYFAGHGTFSPYRYDNIADDRAQTSPVSFDAAGGHVGFVDTNGNVANDWATSTGWAG
ncbi:NlpC/P60 family protein, partial [Kitasatospora sp. NPDC085895]|uniref:NlpC/P60 family protein n=1 Tax=Kitasatospora sp. NPDC085895 TaxID=3155057 RepID=UPI00344BF4DA